jgi:copper(I)-binding protein
MLAGAVLVLGGLTGAGPAHGAGDVIARLGPLTISTTALRPGPARTLTMYMQVGTSGQTSDQLDAAIAADGAAVAVYHQQVNVGEISGLTGCGTELPPPGIVDHWLHYGPLLVPGRSGGRAPPADATLTVPAGPARPAGATLAITLYFAHAGSVILRLPVSRA